MGGFILGITWGHQNPCNKNNDRGMRLSCPYRESGRCQSGQECLYWTCQWVKTLCGSDRRKSIYLLPLLFFCFVTWTKSSVMIITLIVPTSNHPVDHCKSVWSQHARQASCLPFILLALTSCLCSTLPEISYCVVVHHVHEQLSRSFTCVKHIREIIFISTGQQLLWLIQYMKKISCMFSLSFSLCAAYTCSCTM